MRNYLILFNEKLLNELIVTNPHVIPQIHEILFDIPIFKAEKECFCIHVKESRMTSINMYHIMPWEKYQIKELDMFVKK